LLQTTTITGGQVVVVRVDKFVVILSKNARHPEMVLIVNYIELCDQFQKPDSVGANLRQRGAKEEQAL